MSIEQARNAVDAEDTNYWGNEQLNVYFGWSDQDLLDIEEKEIETLGCQYNEDSNLI
jgi:hypothetical protein